MFFPEECKDCHDHRDTLVTTVVHPEKDSSAVKEPLKERPVEEVAARLAQQDQEEQDILTCRFTIIKHICIPACTYLDQLLEQVRFCSMLFLPFAIYRHI